MLNHVKRELARFEAALTHSSTAAEHLFLKADPAVACHIASTHGPRLLMHAADFNRPALARRLLLECGVGQEAAFAGDAPRQPAWTPVFEAAAAGSAEVLDLLLRHWRPDRCARDKSREGYAPMLVAQSAEVVQMLVERRASVNARDPYGVPAASAAIARGNDDALALLLRNGARVEAQEVGLAKSLLSMVVQKKRPRAFGLLLKKGLYRGQDREALSRALDLVSYDIGRSSSCILPSMLLTQGADLLFSMYHGEYRQWGPLSPAATAICKGHLRVARYFIEQVGAVDEDAINALDCNGKTLLSHAAGCGKDVLVRDLLRAGAKQDLPDPGHRAPVVFASIYGQAKVVKMLLRAGAISSACEQSDSALFNAAWDGSSRACMEALLDNNADPNDPKSPASAITGAILGDNEEGMKLLLGRGAKPDATNASGICPLPACFTMGADFDTCWTPTFEKYIKIFRDDHVGPDGISCLHLVASQGRRYHVEFLVQFGKSNVNLRDSDGLTALHYAAFYGNSDTLTALIDAGADCSIRTDVCHLLSMSVEGLDAFLLAACGGHDECARILVQRGGADPDSRCEADMNCYHLALHTEISALALDDRNRITKTLLELGAPPDVANNRGLRPVHIAAVTGNFEIVNLFVSAHGADINCRSSVGEYVASALGIQVPLSQNHTPLHNLARVAMSAPAGALESAVQLGADTSARTNAGESPLHVAARWHACDNCGQLVALGSEVDARDNIGRTPLMIALSSKHSSRFAYLRGTCRYTVESLLNSGAQANATSGRGLCPLHFAARQGEVAVCSLLILHGADVEARTKISNRTCLHMAVLSGETGVVSFLVSRGAPLNGRDSKGQTALYLAVREGLQSTVALLLQLAADAHIPSASGRTPLDVAKRKGHTHIVRILREFGAAAEHRSPGKPTARSRVAGHRLVDEESVAELCIIGELC